MERNEIGPGEIDRWWVDKFIKIIPPIVGINFTNPFRPMDGSAIERDFVIYKSRRIIA
jgi:hypothetical protein